MSLKRKSKKLKINQKNKAKYKMEIEKISLKNAKEEIRNR